MFKAKTDAHEHWRDLGKIQAKSIFTITLFLFPEACLEFLYHILQFHIFQSHINAYYSSYEQDIY